MTLLGQGSHLVHWPIPKTTIVPTFQVAKSVRKGNYAFSDPVWLSVRLGCPSSRDDLDDPPPPRRHAGPNERKEPKSV